MAGFCGSCGAPRTGAGRFCGSCGTPVAEPAGARATGAGPHTAGPGRQPAQTLLSRRPGLAGAGLALGLLGAVALGTLVWPGPAWEGPLRAAAAAASPPPGGAARPAGTGDAGPGPCASDDAGTASPCPSSAGSPTGPTEDPEETWSDTPEPEAAQPGAPTWPEEPQEPATPQRVVVPSVLGLGNMDAPRVLRAAGLNPGVFIAPGDPSVQAQITNRCVAVRQQPGPGAAVAPGSFVSVTVVCPQTNQG